MDEEVGLTPREKAFLAAHPEAKSAPPSEASSGDLRGVGGWLQFLIVALVALGPILTVLMTFSELRLAEDAEPALIGSSDWVVAKYTTWGIVAVYCAVSASAGFLLQKRHKPTTIPMVISIIWLIGPVLSIGGAAAFGGLTGGEGRSLVFAIIWTAYLLRSKRVKNTYRDNPYEVFR